MGAAQWGNNFSNQIVLNTVIRNAGRRSGGGGGGSGGSDDEDPNKKPERALTKIEKIWLGIIFIGLLASLGVGIYFCC